MPESAQRCWKQLGYYDHPPMIGWWLAALLQLSDVEWWLRLPVILQPALLALATYWALPRLTVGIGCTGGFHRSIVLAEEIGAWLATQGYGAISIFHRELERG